MEKIYALWLQPYKKSDTNKNKLYIVTKYKEWKIYEGNMQNAKMLVVVVLGW